MIQTFHIFLSEPSNCSTLPITRSHSCFHSRYFSAAATLTGNNLLVFHAQLRSWAIFKRESLPLSGLGSMWLVRRNRWEGERHIHRAADKRNCSETLLIKSHEMYSLSKKAWEWLYPPQHVGFKTDLGEYRWTHYQHALWKTPWIALLLSPTLVRCLWTQKVAWWP